MTPKVKVCGITSKTDALAAVEAGADALGFMFYPRSKRAVTSPQIASIVKELPPFVSVVGVVVNEEIDEIHRVIRECRLDTVQLHGEESPEFCSQVDCRVIKAFRLQSKSVLEEAKNYRTSAWLLDSYSPKARGGTGDSFNWDWVREAGPLEKPTMIAGGLNPENASQCVQATQPYGLDVSSGVEDSPGRKSPEKMKAFVCATKNAALTHQSGPDKA